MFALVNCFLFCLQYVLHCRRVYMLYSLAGIVPLLFSERAGMLYRETETITDPAHPLYDRTPAPSWIRSRCGFLNMCGTWSSSKLHYYSETQIFANIYRDFQSFKTVSTVDSWLQLGKSRTTDLASNLVGAKTTWVRAIKRGIFCECGAFPLTMANFPYNRIF